MGISRGFPPPSNKLPLPTGRIHQKTEARPGHSWPVAMTPSHSTIMTTIMAATTMASMAVLTIPPWCLWGSAVAVSTRPGGESFAMGRVIQGGLKRRFWKKLFWLWKRHLIPVCCWMISIVFNRIKAELNSSQADETKEMLAGFWQILKSLIRNAYS